MYAILFFVISAAMAGEVDPSVTNAKIRQVKGPHQVFQAKTLNAKTLITIGGTNSHPADFRNVHEWAIERGYRVIGLDYENELTSVVCQTNPDRTCFDNYRSEIVFGQPVSPIVKVNESNSIAHRLLKLLLHLKWTVEWQDVVLVGHSQGAGHVAFFAKQFNVHKVIMTGGPHDYFPGYGPAAWTMERSETDVRSYYSFLHEKDFFGTDAPVGTSRVLIGEINAEVLSIHNDIPANTRAQIFMSNLPFQDPHNSFTNVAYKKVWDFLLK
jgi:pimeloyl-ACP methyl ester carboxylesterase